LYLEIEMRNYIVASWSDADTYDYSGEQIGNRHSKSHMLNPNKANLAAYSDRPEPKTKVSLSDRILPQAKRIRTLTEQLIELEAERKAGMDINTYSELRDVLITKRERAEMLYKKAISIKPKSYYEDQQENTYNCVETPDSVCDNGQNVERENSIVKLAVNIPKDLILFACASLTVLVCLKLIL
jgi:hypothetical protein